MVVFNKRFTKFLKIQQLTLTKHLEPLSCVYLTMYR